MERNFQEELKKAQVKVRELGATREKLVGDSRVAEAQVTQAVTQLKALGIDDADKLTVDQLNDLRATTQKDLEANLDALQKQIAAGEALTAEYESATK